MTFRRGWVLLWTVLAILVGYLLVWRGEGTVGPLGRTLRTLELWTYDSRMARRPRRPTTPDVVVVAIDGPSESKLGAFPWSRVHHAELIKRLEAAGARVIAFDVLFAGKRTPEEDQALVGAVAQGGNVITSIFGDRVRTRTAEGVSEHLELPELAPGLKEALGDQGLGDVGALPDADQGVRRCVVWVRSDQRQTFPTLDILAVERFTGLKFTPKLPMTDSATLGDRPVPTWSEGPGLQVVFLDYPGTPFAWYSYVDVLEGKVGPDSFRGKLVLVGSTSDFNDIYRVPRNENGVTSPERDFYGVLIHACAVDNLLTGHFIRRAPYYLEPAGPSAWMAGCSYGAVLVLLLALGHRSQSLNRMLALTAVLVLGYLVLATALFVIQGIYLNVCIPLVMVGVLTAGVAFHDTRKMRQVLGRFVPDHKVDELVHRLEHTGRDHQTQEATVLFVDIRDYTTLSEKLNDPAQVRTLVGHFHKAVAQVIEKHGGYVCDFQGDAQMVAFGVSPKAADHARRAVAAAQAMPSQVEALNQELAEGYRELSQGGEPVFRFGVGICTGPVSVGYLESGGKLQHTVLGDTTNTAARLQGVARDLGVITVISHTTVAQLKDEFALRELPAAPLKGKSEPHAIYGLASE